MVILPDSSGEVVVVLTTAKVMINYGIITTSAYVFEHICI